MKHLEYIHYFILILIFIAAICSAYVMTYSITNYSLGNSKIKYYNTWQFPMLLALLLDGFLVF